MPAADADRVFAGSIPQIYERHLVPLIFEPCAADLAARVAMLRPARVLELAAGTGVVTRHLARLLPADTTIVATDLNGPMLEEAQALGTARPVTWRRADAMALPFDDASFDAVVVQCGVMFFPDKPRAFAEARRVLAPGGRFLFSVWDRIEANALADTVTQAVAVLFPDDPPRFLARTPHGYHDPAAIARDLAAGGFDKVPDFTTLPLRSQAPSARDPAVGYCQGTPLRSEIEARGADRLAEATDAAAAEVARRHGAGPLDEPMQAIVVAVRR